jgi:dTDP-4-dehydrorhamnose reductase
MLGTELSLLLEKNNIPFIGTDREVDITDKGALIDFTKEHPIKWIINCAAYTAVEKAEDDAENCKKLNAIGAGNIALCAKTISAKLIHISTDYVFDGNGISEEGILRPYREDDKTNPTGVYGITKRDGELSVLENNSNSYIIRTAWLYGKYGNNFVHTMIKFMNERNEIKVVDDQRGSPTWTLDLALAVLTIINKSDNGRDIPFGVYHFTNEGNITWCDFAKEIYKQGTKLGIISNECKINSCTSLEYPTKAKRPAYSVLDKTKIKTTLGVNVPEWDYSLQEYIKSYA